MSTVLTCPSCGRKAPALLLEPLGPRACQSCCASLLPTGRRPDRGSTLKWNSEWPLPEESEHGQVGPTPRPAAEPSSHGIRSRRRFAWQVLTRSWAVSTIVHAVTLLTLALIVVEARRPQPVAPLIASIAAPSEPAQLEEAPASKVTQQAVGRIGRMATVATQRVALNVDVDLDQFGSAGEGQFGYDQGVGGLLQLINDPEARPATFFGVPARGENFVFIVDISGSMTQDNRFERAINELRRSLLTLKEYQRYYVIFFSSYTFPMNSEELLPATDKNRTETFRWVAQIRPGGTTFPRQAVELALDLEPDAIFLLSDGNFDPWEAEALLRKPPRDPQLSSAEVPQYIPIHTIAFVSREGEVVMQAISKLTGGTYQFVR